jgi:phosphate starvation-inducible PhoH-like protein
MDQEDKYAKNKRGKKAKKSFHKDIELEINLFDYEKNLDNMNITEFKNTEYLSNKDKIIFENKFSKPRNTSQYKLLSSLKQKDYKIVIASGPAGTGKTLFGVEQGIRNYILGNYEKIIFTRPTVTVDEDLGYLPGTLEEKLNPYIRPIFDILYNFISPKEVENMITDKIIEISPLGFLRGRTFKNCWIVADEMQNSTISQMKMLLTRLGENSRLVITGDLEQNDRHGELNGLEDFLNKMKGRRSDSISSIEFDRTQVEREEVVKEVLEIYETNKIPYSSSDNDSDNSR